MRPVLLLAVAGSVVAAAAGCSLTSGGDGNPLADLHREAVEQGSEQQARILEDGRVTLDEYVESNQAMADCAADEGVAWKVVRFEDMQGPTAIVDPVEVLDGAAGAFSSEVLERCQEQEQFLVERAWGRTRPAISDAAHDLWTECLEGAGYSGEVPRSYHLIGRDLDPELVGPCEDEVWERLLEGGA